MSNYDCGYEDGYEDGHIESYNEGFEEGLDEGHTNGRHDGIDLGFQEGRRSVQGQLDKVTAERDELSELTGKSIDAMKSISASMDVTGVNMNKMLAFNEKAVGLLLLCKGALTEAWEVIAKMPRTEDGEPIYPGRTVYSPRGHYVKETEVLTWGHATYLGIPRSRGYSTYELAKEKLSS